MRGNRGEWSEVYVLFKLLSDQQLFLGNENIEKLENVVYPILKVLRAESQGTVEYSVQDEIVVVSENQEVLRIPIITFQEKALLLLNAIKSSKERTSTNRHKFHSPTMKFRRPTPSKQEVKSRIELPIYKTKE